MRIGQRSAIHFTAKITASLIGFLVTVYLARVLGAQQLGVYFLVIAVVIWLKILTGMGIQSALTKRLSEQGASDSYLAAGTIVQSAAFIVIVLVLILVREPLGAYLRNIGITPLIAVLFASLCLSFVTSALDGYHLVHISSLLTPLDRLFRGIFQVTAVVLGFGVIGLLAGYGIAAVGAAIVGMAVLPGRLTLPNRHHFDDLLSFARFSWVNNMSTRAFTSMDTVILGIFVGSGLIGIYEIAWNLASILAVFGESITRTLFPEMSRLSSQDQVETVTRRLTEGFQYTGLLLVPGLVGGLVVGERVLAIYGSEFSRGHLILVILIVARLLYAYSAQLISGLNAIDRPELGFRVNGTFIATNVVLNVLLIWQFGWIGAAVATAVSATIALLLSYRLVSQLLKFKLPYKSIAYQAFAAVLMGVIVKIALGFLPTDIITTFALVLIGAGFYLGVLLGISSRFRSTIRANLPIG